MNDSHLQSLILQKGGSVAEALVALAAEQNPGHAYTQARLAEELGVTRQVLQETLRPQYRGRRYAHVRRSIESQMGLTQYFLDVVLDDGA